MSSTLEELKSRVDELTTRYRKASEKKASLSGLLQAKKEELSALIAEIKAAGLDPKTIKEQRDTLKLEVEEMVAKFDSDLTAVEDALKTYDKGTT